MIDLGEALGATWGDLDRGTVGVMEDRVIVD